MLKEIELIGRRRDVNKELLDLLERIKVIHEKKAKDYAAAANIDENFERSAQLTSWFNNALDKAFVSHIATKLARLSTLLNKKDAPNNESIEDTFLDLTTYCALWSANYQRRIKYAPEAPPMITKEQFEQIKQSMVCLHTYKSQRKDGSFYCDTCFATIR